ncbi:tetratricopeptide repeat protein [Parapedobacter sp. 10938]|uniref:tetratricopeptide repeat protein n=1 Tax=Parapedobacter flavus TaxID=3110225 RepID=UPI002DB5CD1A|nr:tetratricopeptide repeat protein [Parapedobacter sp. 10938]MEC3879563.1 tetratricopeptide repeat protein [Parapedobacter sp. 10938]
MWRVIVKISRLLVMVGGVWCTVGGAFAQQTTVPAAGRTTDSLAVKSLFDKGVRQKSAGQLALAEKTFEAVVGLQPDADQAYFQLAHIYMDSEDFTAASRAALHAAELEPDNESYWNVVLDAYRKTRNVKAIPVVLDELIRLNPENAAFYHEKAYALFLDKQYNAALATCDTIGARFGATDDQYLTKHQIYLAQGDTATAINELEEWVAKKPRESKAYILLAEMYTKADDAEKALDLLDEAAAIFPHEPLVWLGKSDAYLAMGKQKQANRYLREAFGSDSLGMDAKAGILYNTLANKRQPLDQGDVGGLADLFAQTYPKEAKAHAVRGDIYRQLQQPDVARDAYLAALDINQYIEGVWQQLLQVELQLGRYDDVESHGKEALALFPNQPLMLFFTGHGYLGNKKYQEARVNLEAALNNARGEHTPLLTQLYSSLGDVYNAMDMHAESDVAYEEAIALDSTNAYALNNYAYYLALRKQKLPLAAEMSKRSNELAPDFPSYQDTYAWVLFQQGDYKAALSWIEKAIDSSDTASETLLEHYGDILAKLGQVGKAVTQWKKARSLSEAVGKDIDKLSQKIDAKQYLD